MEGKEGGRRNVGVSVLNVDFESIMILHMHFSTH